jgi:methionyl-tRNA synthetase
MLMAAGLPLPKTVFAHGWLLVGGEKMSKTKLTGIAPSQIVDTFGADALRYYFLRAIQFGSDGSFSWEHLSAVYSSELANGLGNLAARVTAMVGRYFGGVLPAAASVGPAEQAIADKLAHTVRVADDAVVGLRFHEALAAIDELVDAVNGYLTEQEPWKVAKDDSPQAQERLATILYTAAEALRGIAVLHHPFMPKATTTLWKQLGAESDLGPIEAQPLTNAGRWGILPPGSVLTKGEPLFPRIEESETS